MKTIIALLLAVCSGSAMAGNVDRLCFKLGDTGSAPYQPGKNGEQGPE